jgi:hypothetical protein
MPVTIKAQRTHHTSSVTREVQLTVEVNDRELGKAFEVVQGGVTGYEGFYLEGVPLADVFARGWCVCIGTPGRWDTLYVLGAEMKRAFELLGLSTRE